MNKIVFLIGNLGGGGAERVTISLANYFSKKGYLITLIAFSKENNNYEINDSVQIKYLPEKKSKISNFKRVLSLKNILKEEKPNVVISLGLGYQFLFFGNLLKKYHFILSERNSPNDFYTTTASKIYTKYCYKRADCVVFQTREAANYYKNIVKKISVVIPNPIKEELPLPYQGVREKRIVAVSRLDPQKNLLLLLKGFEIFSARYPEYILEIYGKGKQREELIKFAKSVSLEDKIIFKGQVDNVHEKILNSTMYISTSNYEGMSNSMLEAMALGLPVICTDCPIGGARAVIKHGTNGLLIQTNNLEDLVKAMFKIVENPEFASQLAQNASRLRTDLSIEKIAPEWEKLINYK